MVTVLNCVAASAIAQPAQPINLRCEYHTNPVGIDVAQPRLSWEVRDARRGAMQSAYQVVVATTEEGLAAQSDLLWDSGKVQSDQSVQVAYAGPALKSGHCYFWQVRTWDADDEASAYSEPAFWSMGLLTPDDWKGQWIGQIQDLHRHPVYLDRAPQETLRCQKAMEHHVDLGL